MVQILSTLIGADGGEVRVAGHDLAREPDAVRAAIGVTGQFPAVDNLLTGEENLLLMADLHHLSRSEGRQRAPHCSTASIWSTRESRCSPPTPAACGAGSTWR
jgi:ABC-type multidrug transport system ATPase subunit